MITITKYEKKITNSKSQELAHTKCKGVFTQGYHLSAHSRRSMHAAATDKGDATPLRLELSHPTASLIGHG
jgi:hypothetical protein